MLLRVLLVAAMLVVAASSTRRGVMVLILSCVLQDVIRKLDDAPGSGFLWTALAGLVLIATVVGLLLRGERRTLQASRADRLQGPLIALVVIVLLQAVVAYARVRSLAVPLLGVAMYLFPLAALQVGLVVGRDRQTVERLLGVYVTVACIGLGAMLLSRAGVTHPLLDGVGKELVTYGARIGVVRLEQGLFRAPEIAGWHASMVLCICLYWAGQGRRRVWIPLMILAGLAALWTGRRKWLLTPALTFMVAHVGAALMGLNRSRIAAGGLAAAVLLVGTGWFVVATSDTGTVTGAHVARLTLMEDHASSRVSALAARGPLDVIHRVGWLGGGVGIAQQGTRHLAGRHAVEIAGWGAEGGLGQILAELGIPGLLASLLVASIVASLLVRSIRHCAHAGASTEGWFLVWGSAALLANAMAFLLAKQAFGDPFVVGWLGLLAGCCVARAGHVMAPAPPDTRAATYRLRVLTSPPAS